MDPLKAFEEQILTPQELEALLKAADEFPSETVRRLKEKKNAADRHRSSNKPDA